MMKMKRQPVEVYGFGRRLPTRTDRSVRALRYVAACAILLMLAWAPW